MIRSFLVPGCIALILLLARSPVLAQLPNPDFETWISGEPAGWYTSNHPELDPSSVNVTQTSDAHSGTSAVRGEIISAFSNDTVFPGPFDHWPHLTSAYVDDDNNTKGFPITGRPKQLRGWWKYQPVGETGLFGVTVYLFKGEKAIGLGGRSRFAISTDTAYRQFVAPINYLTDEYPDTIYISFGISVGDLGTVFYVDDISLTFLEVLRPVADESVIAGESYKIEWDIAFGTVDIFYSLDGGQSYQPLATNYPADSTHYDWEVPDDLLSPNALIKIVNTEDASDFAVSDTFIIKPWQLTRIDGSGDFELFEPDEDGWSPANNAANSWPSSWWSQFDYILGTDPHTGAIYPGLTQFNNAQPSDHPDWPLWVDVFGVPQCYLGSSSPPTTYRTRALNRWTAFKGAWGGSCEGYAVSSLLAFYHKDELLARFPGIGGFTDLFSVPVTTDGRAAVNQYYTHQTGDPYRTYENQRVNTIDARQTLIELKQMFSENNVDARPLGFYNNNGSGGHAVTPYGLERIGTSDRFTLRVYDSNVPGVTTQVITIDSAANTWTDGTGLSWGSGMTGCLLGLPSGQHFDTPGLSIAPGARFRTAPSPSSRVDGLEVFNTSGAGIRIVDASGDSIGYADSTAFGTIAGSSPMIPRTGAFHPPVGYSLPTGGYLVEMRDVPGTDAYVMFFTDSTTHHYRRSGILAGETDRLGWMDGVGVSNPDGVGRTISLETVVSLDSTERIFTLSGLGIAPGDSVFVKGSGADALSAANPGGATAYDLEVRLATGGGVSIFFHAGVPIGAGATHSIEPSWGDVEGTPVKILIDEGSDGSVDDSMFVSNELTSVEDRIASAAPSEYRLLRNYPNPFNPATVISYELPEASEVSLKVYTLAGEEVAILAEGIRQPGTYRVRFDGSGLPSGVYIYRLTAGSFTASGKMILMK